MFDIKVKGVRKVLVDLSHGKVYKAVYKNVFVHEYKYYIHEILVDVVTLENLYVKLIHQTI